ncbi:uncharacterized protein LOC134332231 [Trichomycterus rosablanca]|uniref:uncharacterized protein LOC134310030 n=1 Tax=Trichomycterus rosablanca TaxID=2290929 RepID=UPI002F351AE3
MATRQVAVEKKKEAAKARLSKFREKIYSNPELLEEYRRRERQRYQERKKNRKIKTTRDLTKKQHDKKKKQWRENSAKYYRKKKQLQALLDITPASENENSFQHEEINSQELKNSNSEYTAEHKSLTEHIPVTSLLTISLTPTTEERYLNLAGPVGASTPHTPPPETRKKERRAKLVSKLRSKLRYAEEKLQEKSKELQNLKKRIKRLEARKKTANRPTVNNVQKVRKTREGFPTIPNSSKRREMRKLVSRFLHQDDVSTVVNGKAGEISPVLQTEAILDS